jgi:hypothetical protein
MDTIGVALIVGGMAFLCSGLVFLLPTERRISSSQKSFEKNQQEIADYLRQIRDQQSDRS